MKHKAIYALYPNVVTVDDGVGAWDTDGNLVSIDYDLVASWEDPEQYKYDRIVEYPSVVDQLDVIYHEGIDGWKEKIQAVKSKYPKPE